MSGKNPKQFHTCPECDAPTHAPGKCQSCHLIDDGLIGKDGARPNQPAPDASSLGCAIITLACALFFILGVAAFAALVGIFTLIL